MTTESDHAIRLEAPYSELLISAPVGILLATETGRIVFFNAEAEKMFGYRSDEILGKMIETLLPERVRSRHQASRREFVKAPAKRIMGRGRDLYARRKDGSEFPVEVGLGFMTSEAGLLVSAVVVDITARKNAEAQREALITELKEALGKVKMLSGMLPICASCKKIRDDKGYWNQIEAFIRDHAEVEFSHGICPDCAERLYPGVYTNDPDKTAPE